MEEFYTIIDNEGHTVRYSSDNDVGSFLSRINLNECILYKDDEEAKMDIYNIETEWEDGWLNSRDAKFPLRLAKVKNIRKLVEL